jgi:hypothetical protein
MSRHLLARFRHLSGGVAGNLRFQWNKQDDGAIMMPGESGGHAAQLENGDWLLAYPVGNTGTWNYLLHGPKGHHDENPNLPDDPRNYFQYPEHGGRWSEVLGAGRQPHHPDPHSAMRAAEDHYLSIMDSRRGQRPQVNDGYDINQIMRDEGF